MNPFSGTNSFQQNTPKILKRDPEPFQAWYVYPNNLKFMMNMNESSMKKKIQQTTQQCKKCGDKKLFYCIDQNCRNKEMLCKCETQSIQRHFKHRITYILNLFHVDIDKNKENMNQYFKKAQQNINKKISMLQKQLRSLNKLKSLFQTKSSSIKKKSNEQIFIERGYFQSNNVSLSQATNQLQIQSGLFYNFLYDELTKQIKLLETKFETNFSNYAYYPKVVIIPEEGRITTPQNTYNVQSYIRKSLSNNYELYTIKACQLSNLSSLFLHYQNCSQIFAYQGERNCFGPSKQLTIDLSIVLVFPKLKKLTLCLDYCQIEDISQLGNFAKLKVLKLRKISENVLVKLSKFIKEQVQLEELEIQVQKKVPVNLFSHSLKSLTLNGPNVRSYLQNLSIFFLFLQGKNMTSLALNFFLPTDLSEEQIKILQSMKNLKHLQIRDNSKRVVELKELCRERRKIVLVIAKFEREKKTTKSRFHRLFTKYVQYVL